LCKPVNAPQLKLLLDDLTVEPTDDPETIMAKIEEIAHRADSTVRPQKVNILMCRKFCDLIKPQVGMLFYVERHLQDETDPREAVQHAKDYVRERGHETQAMNDHIDRRLEKMGVKTNLDKSVSESAPNLVAKMEETVDVSARFLSKGTKLTDEELVYRFNDIENAIRDLTAGKNPRDRFKRRSRDGERSANKGRGRTRFDDGYSKSESRHRERGDRRDDRRKSEFKPREEEKTAKKDAKRDDRRRGKRRYVHDNDVIVSVHRGDELSEAESDSRSETSEHDQQDSQE
jgi:hypothetical protein